MSRQVYDGLPTTTVLLPVLVVIVTTLVLARGVFRRVWRHFERPIPRLNPKKRFELFSFNRVAEFMTNSRELFKLGRARFPNQPYKIYSNSGDIIIMPRSFLKEMGSNRNFNFIHHFNDNTNAKIPGFGSFQVLDDVPRIINKYLTHQITRLTKPLSHEADVALERVLTNDTEWHPIKVRDDIMSIISQMSTRIFMGEKLCRDQDWVKASADYTKSAFLETAKLSLFPEFMRGYVHWFLPGCKEVRRKLDIVRRVLEPYLAERARIKATSTMSPGGKPTVKFEDSFEWFEQELPAGTHDPAAMQINLSMIAIHTTSDLTAEVMINLAKHPDVVESLRNEVCNVLGGGNLDKSSFANLKLMDSVIKESQRLKPIRMTSFERLVEKDTVLSNGFKLYKGEEIAVDNTTFLDDSVFPNAQSFDAYRFLRMRQTPGEDKHAHLVSTSDSMFGFGFGMHTCPGRFFAANEIKVALCHLVLKYEWRLRNDLEKPQPLERGVDLLQDPKAELELRRRTDNVDLSFLDTE